MAETSATAAKRSRLFSRRELRQQGTRIVRVGSANTLQSNSRRYRFAICANSASSSQNTHSSEQSYIEANREPIDAFSEHSACLNGDDNDPICPDPSAEAAAQSIPSNNSKRDQPQVSPQKDRTEAPGTPPRSKRKRRTMHPITHMSEKARRLRVSPASQQRALSSRHPSASWKRSDAISPPSSPIKLPPPLDIDQGILSFPEQQQAQLSHRASAPSLAVSPWKPPRRTHLTPLRQVRERLKPAREKPPPVFDLPR